MFTQKTLWEKFLAAVELDKRWKTFESFTKTASEVIENEIRRTEERLAVLLRLRATPERFENKLEALRLAEEMSAKLREQRKRLYLEDEQLTPKEREERRVWRLQVTPRAECAHGKGGATSRWGVDIYGANKSFGRRPLDYSVGCHTFIDGSTKIWCLHNCGFIAWKKSDGTEDGNWAEAIKMLQDSTNHPSSSERVVPS